MTTSVPPTGSSESPLQLRPAVQLAVGQLPEAEQSLMQIAVRVLAPHLKTPCEVVNQPQADITLQPEGAEMLSLVTRHAQRSVERPVRLSPLSDALSELIDDLLMRERAPAAQHARGAEAAGPIGDPIAAASNDPHAIPATPLLDLLLLREHAGPLRLSLASGLTMHIDQRYHTAWSGEAIESLAGALGDGVIVALEPLAVPGFLQQVGKNSALHTILVEQLCWLLPHTASSAELLGRWRQPDDARFLLETWPNLSSQADMLAWLPVLTAASRAPLAMRDALRIAERAGIPNERARDGICLLLMFKHAVLRPLETPAEPAFIAPTSTAANPAPAAPSSGLLSRLRSRLRNRTD